MAAIASVVSAALDEFRNQIPPAIFQAYVEDSINMTDRWDKSEVLVAEIDGQIVGTVSFYPDASGEGLGLPREWASFRTLAVHPATRGQGVGRALIKTCIDKARRLGVPTLGIHTAAVMRAACQLYEQAGFRRSAEHDVLATGALELGDGVGEVAVIAYRLDFAAPPID